MGLEDYRKKRNFKKTPEPSGVGKSQNSEQLRFVVQKHAASRLHYDFRLELDGTLKSWAIPKGPSLNPDDKRLSMMVEDHPLSYENFEGIIPKGNYGAGTVMVWDKGVYSSIVTTDRKQSEQELKKGLAKGHLSFLLAGEKLNGEFALAKITGNEDNAWLLIKKNDTYSSTEDILKKDRSVLTKRTMEEIAEKAEGEGKVWVSGKSTEFDLKDTPQAKMPHQANPMLTTLVEKPFDDDEWAFEIKWDGYRTISFLEDGEVNLLSRNNQSLNEKFALVKAALTDLPVNAVLDGEVVVVDSEGHPRFQLLQSYTETGEGQPIYYIFDILYLNGHDLTGLTLLERKEILTQVIRENEILRISKHIVGQGKSFFDLAAKSNLEGIIAKRSGSQYLPGKRTREWLKIKVKSRQEAVIAGYTKGRASRKFFGALILGVYKGKELIYIGHTGGGFTEEILNSLYEKMQPLKRGTSPFKQIPKTNAPVIWIEPQLVCEIEFSEWTNEGNMRQPIFLGLREDKEASSVVREQTVHPEVVKTKLVHNPKLTNLNKVYWPENRITKGDLINYYTEIADFLLPYLKDRPESLHRHPNGIAGKSFWQKNMGELPPSWIETVEIFSETENKIINYLLCQDKESLVYMVNLGCIEINPWNSRVQNLENPDYLIFDLDPEQIEFSEVVKVAKTIHEVLEQAKVPNFCKTSGATGLHIYSPLAAKYTYEQAKQFAEIIAHLINRQLPETTSLERSPSKRQGKVYLDYLQNRRGQTLASAYSVRPTPGATVSTPLRWDEVDEKLNPKDFTIKTIFPRLKRYGDDLWSGVLGEEVDITSALNALASYSSQNTPEK